MTSTRVILGYAWRRRTGGTDTKNSPENNNIDFNNDNSIQHTNHCKNDNDNEDEDDLGLTDYLIEVAKDQLHEDHLIREQSLKQIRHFLQFNDDVQNVRLDNSFLLRFLRFKKFNMFQTEQIILKYLNFRRTFPHITTNLDYSYMKQLNLLTSGYIFVSPIRDDFGRRVIIVNAKYLNSKIYTSYDQAKAHLIVYETLLEDSENQILGFVHVGDLAGTQTGHVTNWNPTEFVRIMKWGEQSIPMRHKGIHLLNVPTSVKWIIDFIKGRISPKIKERIYAYKNHTDLYKNLNMNCLPLEMGGNIPMKDMIELWKLELFNKNHKLIQLDNMKILNDRGIISQRRQNKNLKKNFNQNQKTQQHNLDTTKIVGSFRKLEFD